MLGPNGSSSTSGADRREHASPRYVEMYTTPLKIVASGEPIADYTMDVERLNITRDN